MILRQKLQMMLILLLTFFAFASYSQGTTGWLQWLTVVLLFTFMLVFDLMFTNEHNFIFDPDAENWRRKMVSSSSIAVVVAIVFYVS